MAFCKEHGIDFCKKRGGFCRACRSKETGIHLPRCGCIYREKPNGFLALMAVCAEHRFFKVQPDIDGCLIDEAKARVV